MIFMIVTRVFILVVIFCHFNCNSLKLSNLLSKTNVFLHLVAFSITANPVISQATINDPVAIQRFEDSYKELLDLDKNWEKYSSNGDNIRRVLGTVYTPPSCDRPLCSSEAFVNKFIQKNMNDLDFDLFDQSSSLYIQALNQADFLAYSSIFASYGNGGAGVNYIGESHKQILSAIQHLNDMINILKK